MVVRDSSLIQPDTLSPITPTNNTLLSQRQQSIILDDTDKGNYYPKAKCPFGCVAAATEPSPLLQIFSSSSLLPCATISHLPSSPLRNRPENPSPLQIPQRPLFSLAKPSPISPLLPSAPQLLTVVKTHLLPKLQTRSSCSASPSAPLSPSQMRQPSITVVLTDSATDRDWSSTSFRAKRLEQHPTKVSINEAREVCHNWWMREALEELCKEQSRNLQAQS
ncbi:hypothetical protein OIU85_005602 [Salix viminalis]|uniref:Uncharacterized protein n=1 Tax=Salix viminalis TaxID=40686 RepID=A0A9Q0PJB3_SALVM|nr:hypothetical protein OIU85_005602 [Salix viminalis]